MAALLEILKKFEDSNKPLVEQVLRQIEREHNAWTVAAVAKFDIKTLESQLKAVEARNPFFELNENDRATLAQRILKTATGLLEDERKREEKRRSRPAVALDDLASVVRVPRAVKD